MAKFLLETNSSFILLKLEDNDYVFYNSIRHIGCRLKYVEVKILDLLYTYKNADFIISNVSENKRNIIKSALDFIEAEGLLSTEPLRYIDDDSNYYPLSYYLHLTYKCNLNCSYCYNREIRQECVSSELLLDEWKTIVDKISPYAKEIVFTGGEFMLNKDCVEIAKYIKSNISDVKLSCISNGIHHLGDDNLHELFGYIDGISLSCDSIEREGLRKGFKSDLFISNVKWIRQNYPHVNVAISSVLTKQNEHDIVNTSQFCKNNQCSFDINILAPENVTDVLNMPSLSQQEKMAINTEPSSYIKKLNMPKHRCGAGRNICSVDPMGNVYPCQCLHYNEFLMGNLLRDNIEKIFGNDCFVKLMPSVDSIPVCSSCNVRYICGGGCLATGYKLNNNRLGRNHLACHLNYLNSIEKLKRLNNRI